MAADRHDVIRLLRTDDVPTLAELLRRNEEFLAPWQPAREPAYFEDGTQLQMSRRELAEHAAGRMVPFVIVDRAGNIAGKLTLSGVTHGAFRSTSLGYWVSEDRNGQGLATDAVAAAVAHAFGTLRLHRVQAETLLHNVASQRVLLKNGFRSYGVAEQYLHIAGRWQDHELFQVLADGEERPRS